MNRLAIYCADIGSIKRGNFGWAAVDGDQQGDGDDIDDLVDDLVRSLSAGTKVALGFECPLWVPVSQEPQGLTKGRAVDGNKPWSAGAGASALSAGLTETAWILSQTRQRLAERGVALPRPYLHWDEFNEADTGLFLWEAFVTGAAKAKVEVKGNGHYLSVAGFAPKPKKPAAKAAGVLAGANNPS